MNHGESCIFKQAVHDGGELRAWVVILVVEDVVIRVEDDLEHSREHARLVTFDGRLEEKLVRDSRRSVYDVPSKACRRKEDSR